MRDGDAGRGGEPQADLHEGPAEARPQFTGAPGGGGQAVRLGLGPELGGAGVVQGEMGSACVMGASPFGPA